MENLEPDQDVPASILVPTDEITDEHLEKSIRAFIELTGKNSFYGVVSDGAWSDLDEWEIITEYDARRFCRGGWIIDDGWTIRLIDADDPIVWVPPDVQEDFEAEPGLYVFPAEHRPTAN